MDDEIDYENVSNLVLICEDCGETRYFPTLSEFSYGSFIGRSKNNEYVYVDTFEPDTDTFFKAFEKIYKFNNKKDEHSRKLVQTALGDFFLDPDSCGDHYSINNKLYCTTCNSRNVDWREVLEDDPYPFSSVDHATHKLWSALSEDEQLRLIEKAINDYRG